MPRSTPGSLVPVAVVTPRSPPTKAGGRERLPLEITESAAIKKGKDSAQPPGMGPGQHAVCAREMPAQAAPAQLVPGSMTGPWEQIVRL